MQVFLLSLAIGAAATVLYGRVFTPAMPASTERPTQGRQAASGVEPPLAKTERPHAAAATVPPPKVPAAGPRAARPEPTPLETAQAKAARLAAKETYSREQLHSLLQTTLAGKLTDRELGSGDYDRIADAILRIRASQRVLRGINESDPGSDVRAVYADTLKAAFAEIQDITGVPPSGWGDVLADQSELAENAPGNVGRTQ